VNILARDKASPKQTQHQFQTYTDPSNNVDYVLQIAGRVRRQSPPINARRGSRAQLDRLLDPDDDNFTLAILRRAAAIVGIEVRLEIV
jgi:hypothetical protein